MNYKNLLDQTANILENILIDDNGFKIETEDFGWENTRYVSDSFRIAHIERYSDKALEVLHFTAFPQLNFADPIFGFDIISSGLNVINILVSFSKSNKSFFGILI